MNIYNLDPSADTLITLRLLQRGVKAITISPNHPQHPGCSSCQLETVNGRLVDVRPAHMDLEFKFEVFPIEATPGTARATGISWALNFATPVFARLLETEEWLDPSIPIRECVGENPIMQCQGLPGSAPHAATAVCRYAGAIELIGNDGQCIVMASGSFPYTLHVQGFAEDERFDRSAYAAFKN